MLKSNKMKKNATYLLVLGLLVTIVACQDNTERTQLNRYTDEEWQVLGNVVDLPEQTYNYDVTFPRHFQNFGGGELFISADMATLGRVLFYDKKLSANDEVSCSSCHSQANAFSDKVALSDGFEGVKTKRNSFALGTVPNFEASYGGFGGESHLFWDERAMTIEQQCEMTISDPIEMGMNLADLAEKLKKEAYYRVLFQKAFQTEEIQEQLIVSALSQFIRSFNTTQTKFDEGLNNVLDIEVDFPNFTSKENIGKTLFMANCESCHGGSQFTPNISTANNGLDAVYTDNGIGEISNLSFQDGVFKVPLLRNVKLTDPYMHDGRFATLEAVIDHYSNGISNHTNLHPNLKTNANQPIRMNFTQTEKEALIAYLNTFTDEEFIRDVRFSDPFK
jgi:cytochrome c peroxidase